MYANVLQLHLESWLTGQRIPNIFDLLLQRLNWCSNVHGFIFKSYWWNCYVHNERYTIAQLHKTEWVILISVNIDWQVGHFPSQFAAAGVWKRCRWTSIHQLRASLNQPEEWLSITASEIIVVSNLQQQPFEKQQVMEGEMPPKHCVRSAAGIFVAQALPCLALPACLCPKLFDWVRSGSRQLWLKSAANLQTQKDFFWTNN